MNQPPAPTLNMSMTFQRPLAVLIPNGTYSVYRKGTRWVCLRAYATDGVETSLEQRLQEILKNHNRMQLFFENDETLIEFQTDTDPALGQLRDFIALSRRHGSFHVATMAEVTAATKVAIPDTEGHWSATLPNVLVSMPHGQGLLFDSLIHALPNWHWCLNDVLNSPHYAYHYEVLLSYLGQYGALARRENLKTTEGERIAISLDQDFNFYESSVPLEGSVMVVPDDTRHPVLHFFVKDSLAPAVVEKKSLGDPFPATMYRMERPQLSNCHEASSLKHTSREIPLDILAAAQPVT